MKRVLLAATMLAVPMAAKAQPITGLYVGAGVGANFMQASSFRSLYIDSAGAAKAVSGDNGGNARGGFNTGLVGLGSVGWGFGNGLRVEIEGNYRRNSLNTVESSSTSLSAAGRERKIGVMANALFDMDIGFPWIYPYVGAGAGYSWARWDGVSYPGLPGAINDTEGSFAYQAMVGVSLPIPWVVGLSATAEYRFMGLYGDRVYHVDALPGFTQKVGGEYNHAVLIGFRYAPFVRPPAVAAAAPAPVAAPAPAPARTYLVFFDWDRADLTPRARQIIAEAAQNSTRVQYTRIEVNGYTDTSGTPQYNQRLSVRRAQAVRSELIRDGVPANAIDIHGYGETHLLVPTGQGVREPQNRRVEIILR